MIAAKRADRVELAHLERASAIDPGEIVAEFSLLSDGSLLARYDDGWKPHDQVPLRHLPYACAVARRLVRWGARITAGSIPEVGRP